MANAFGKSLLVVAALVVSGVATAQEEAFKEGVKLLRLGERPAALEKFREALAADLSNEERLGVYRSVSQDEWYMLLSESGDVRKIAQSILERAKLDRVERSRDEGEIQALVDTVCAQDSGLQDRRQAVNKLVASHGEFAVPALVAKLANPDDERGQIEALVALQNIGHVATMPLIEALKSSNVNVRASVAAALTHIGDRRAIPAMAALVQLDDQENVRDIARKFLSKMGASGGASDLYVASARTYLAGKGVRPGEMSDVAWSLEDDALVFADVPAEIYGLELAKKFAYEALSIDPASPDAQSLVAQSYLAQASVIEQSLAQDPGNESLSPWADRVPELKIPALASGPSVLRSALAEARSTGLVSVAVGAIDALAKTESRGALADCAPLIAALDDSDKRISYAAALALVEASGGAAVPAADKVVANLANAVGEEAVRVIHVIDPSADMKGVAEVAASQQGIRIATDVNASEGMNSLYTFPKVDVVLINNVLPDRMPQDVIGLLRKDPRMAAVKILIMAKDPDTASEEFGDTVDGVIARPESGESLVQAVNAALEGVPIDASSASAERVATGASLALSKLANSKINIGQALQSLAAQLGRADAIAIPAAHALGLSGGVEHLDDLIATVTGSGSAELQIAAATAMGDILGRLGDAPSEIVEGLMAVLGSGASVELKTAVGTALGKARLLPGDKLKLLEALRGAPKIDG